MNKNDWKTNSVPNKVAIVCENNNKVMLADVISLNERMLVAAIAGVKITLASQKQNGVYVGRMGGLDLVYKQ
jgi:hypothetical protein